MKIDLKRDKGILEPRKFLAEDAVGSQLSEEELIAETLRRRHSSQKTESDGDETPEVPKEKKAKSSQKKKSSSRKPLRELFLFILMLAVIAFYLNRKGILYSSIDIVKDYYYELLGIHPELPATQDDLDQYDEYFSGDSLILDTPATEEVLSEDLFNELMPLTPELAALKDSIESMKPESLYVQLPDGRDTAIAYQEMSVIEEDVIDLSDDDINIINNRSLLLMITEMITSFPVEYGSGHIFLKRDALTMTAPRGGEWVPEMQSILDKFVQGSFIEDYSTGTAKITSKFEIVMNAERDFVGQSFDAMRLLDILANPFADYLNEIIIDPALETNDNPVQISFSGSMQQIQYILSSWAESRSNYLVQGIDIDFQRETLHMQIGVTFFNYTP